MCERNVCVRELYLRKILDFEIWLRKLVVTGSSLSCVYIPANKINKRYITRKQQT